MMSGGCCGAKKQKLATASNGVCCNGRSADDCCNGVKQNGECCPDSRNGYCDEGCVYGCGLGTGTATTNGGYLANGAHMGLLGQKPLKFASVEMAVYCFDVLHSYLHNYETPKAPRFPNNQFPLFVTWKMGKEKKLRGCIGTFTSTSLHQGLREYSITSACKDSRFDPITADDFSRLHCSISLLLDFEVAEHYLDWQIGIHGIRIEFNNEKGSKKAATFLPEVSAEQGWTHIQTIDSLLRKGGFKGTITPEIRTSVCVVRFQSEKIGASYSEYVSFKKTGSLNGLCGLSSSSESQHNGSVGCDVPSVGSSTSCRPPSTVTPQDYHGLFSGKPGQKKQHMQQGHAHHSSVLLIGGSGPAPSSLGRALVGSSPRATNASRHNAPPFNHPYRP